MTGKLLTVCIPTYNRAGYLKQTLDVLPPQVSPEVEVIVSDNCSSDDTWAYLGTLSGRVERFRHNTNVGADANMFACLQRGTGQYVWMLCDDDLPCSNTVACILRAIKTLNQPPLIYLRSDWKDAKVTGYSDAPVAASWVALDRNAFLVSISYFFTVASSIVVRRDCVDMEFVKAQIGTSLVPAAITLATAGRSDGAVVSDLPLIICRGDNSGGYNGLVVFTRNVIRLLAAVQPLGYQKRVLRRVYDENLGGVVVYMVINWPWDRAGLLALATSSYHYPSFYSRVLPALWWTGLQRRFGR
jgi:glycosyltransferase involved in cell wall biosynthesis